MVGGLMPVDANALAALPPKAVFQSYMLYR